MVVAVVAVEVRMRMGMVVVLLPRVRMATVRMLVGGMPRGPRRLDARGWWVLARRRRRLRARA
jgi:hypothetical protein